MVYTNFTFIAACKNHSAVPALRRQRFAGKLILFFRGERSRRKPVLIEYANIVASPSFPKVAGSHYSFTARRLKLHLLPSNEALAGSHFPSGVRISNPRGSPLHSSFLPPVLNVITAVESPFSSMDLKTVNRDKPRLSCKYFSMQD